MDGQFHHMKTQTILVTGSSGLIGSEAVEHFGRQGHQVHGVDNNMRQVFFGDPGDQSHHPNWEITIGLDGIFPQIIADHSHRLRVSAVR